MRIEQGGLRLILETDDIERDYPGDGELVECPTCFALVRVQKELAHKVWAR